MQMIKSDEGYVVEVDGKKRVFIKTYRNPYHKGNCYLNFNLEDVKALRDIPVFDLIYKEEASPLQVMLSSLEVEKGHYLASKGFTKARSCYEMEVKKEDLILKVPLDEDILKRTLRDQEGFKECSKMMFEYYKEIHENINPLTIPFEAFLEILPKAAYYTQKNEQIEHVAFVEENEIAYVASRDADAFQSFIRALLEILFKEYETIEFEADDVDQVAMKLKDLFQQKTTETFDTWIYNIKK